MAYQLQIKNGTLEEWITSNPILAEGEMGVVIGDSKAFVIGDGVTHFDELTQLPFGLDAYEVLKRNGYKGTKSDFCRQLDSSLRMPEQQAGTLTNAGAGWNSFTFMKEFSEDVYVILTPQEAAVFASVKNITKQGFHYCLYDASGNTVSSNVVVNYMATAVSELNMAQAIAKAAGLNPFDFDNLTDLFASHAAEVVGNEAAFNLVKRSGMAAGRYICHLTGLNPVTYFNMVSLAGDETAMNTIAVTEEALTFIVMAIGAYDSIRLGTMSMSKYLVGLISLAPEGYSTVTNLLDDNTALTALVADLTAMQAFTGSEIACAEMVVHSTACSAVASSDIAMQAVASSDIAMQAVASSDIAMQAVASSDIAMQAVASSDIAMQAVASSDIAYNAIYNNSDAYATLLESELAMTTIAGDQAAILALIGDSTRCQKLSASTVAMAAVSASTVAMAAVSASTVAMAAVSASTVAMAAVSASTVARNAIQTNSASWKVVTDSNEFIAKFAIGCLENSTYKPENFANMAAIIANAGALKALAASSTAMTALAASSTARSILWNNQGVAMSAINKVDMAIAKYAIGCLNNSSYSPANFATMSSVIANQGALGALAGSSVAMNALAGSSVAMNALAGSSVAMNALAGSSVAMNALAGSSVAMNALAGSSVAYNALLNSSLLKTRNKSGNNWITETVHSGKGIAIDVYGASVSGGNGWVKTNDVSTAFNSNNTTTKIMKSYSSSLSWYVYQSGSILKYIQL